MRVAHVGPTRRSDPLAGWKNVPGTSVWFVIRQDGDEPDELFVVAYSEKKTHRREHFACIGVENARSRVLEFARIAEFQEMCVPGDRR